MTSVKRYGLNKLFLRLELITFAVQANDLSYAITIMSSENFLRVHECFAAVTDFKPFYKN